MKWAALILGGSFMLASAAVSQVQPAVTPLQAAPLQVAPLQAVELSSLFTTSALGQDDRFDQQADRAALVAAIDHSLTYLQTPEAATAYQNYSLTAFNLERVQRSLQRFRQLVLTVPNAAALRQAVQREFELYRSTGRDGDGTVSFTGYFEPIYQASRVATPRFRYPIYRLPPDFNRWSQPHPTRLELEGADGLQGAQGQLRGLELAWLPDRLEAYLIQVQGSARLQLTDGATISIGYAGRTDYPYASIGQALVQAGKITAADLTLAAVVQHFRQHPADLDIYLPQNARFIFFKETTGRPATGSLKVPVTAERSIATDKSLMPPGALALIHTELPNAAGSLSSTSRYVLDQDTGGAIRGAGRVDLFMGTGPAAGDRAGLINHSGQLYYLLLKP